MLVDEGKGDGIALTLTREAPVQRQGERAIIKSRERVKRHGEVNTPPWVVELMLDIAKADVEQIDTTVLEPAAGDGNFLVAILRRKLSTVLQTIAPMEMQRESLFALASIYGIELLADNVADARSRMFAEFREFHKQHGIELVPDSDVFRAAEFLINTNIVHGNTLTRKTNEGHPIVFNWWVRRAWPGSVRRDPFTLDSMLSNKEKPIQFDLFSVDHVNSTDFPTYRVCKIEKVYLEATI